MPDNSVTTTFFADEKEAVAAITRLEKKLEDLENKLKHAGKKEHAHGIAEGFKEAGGELAALAVGFASAKALAEGIEESIREWHIEADKAFLSVDKLHRALAVRAAGFGPQGAKAIEQVNEAANRAALPHEMAHALFGDIKEHGIGNEDLLKNFPELAAAFKVTNEAKGGMVSSQEFANAIEKSLDRAAPKTGVAFARAARDVFAATRGTTMQVGDIAALSEIFETSKAGKGGLQNPKHQQALSLMGMTFEDIDMQGEDFATVMERLQQGIGRVKPEDRMSVMKLLTGDAGMARRALAGMGKLKENRGLYDAAIDVSTSGVAAGQQRLASEKEERLAAQGSNFENLAETAEQMQQARGTSPLLAGFRRKIAEAGRIFGDDMGIRLGYTSIGTRPEDNITVEKIKARAAEKEAGFTAQQGEQVVELLEKQNELLGKMVDAKPRPRRGKGVEE